MVFNSLSLLSLGALVLGLLGSIPRTMAAPYEPAGNQVLFGAWIDTQVGYADSPIKFNQRIQQNTAVFQIAQDIPLPKYNYTTGSGGAALENLIELSGTDAAVFLTVYPYQGFNTVTVADFTALGEQILDYQKNLNRTVFLRYAPEMQGIWNAYGMQPTGFNVSWHIMYNAVKSVAPATIMVWAPNTPQGYPYGQSFTAQNTSPADQIALDTNGDGVLTSADNSLDPYYPGDAVVDWIGISLYYKGPPGSDTTNSVQPAGYCSLAINGTDPEYMTPVSNWYTPYCANKPDKACMFAESGAAWHVNDAGLATQLSLQQGWISDCITNMTMFDTFPRLKMVMQFEYEKFETSNLGTQDLRDFRITNSTGVLAELLADLTPANAARFSWANSRAPPTSISSINAPAATNSAGSTVIQQITATFRARPTGFPALFGMTSDGTQRAEIVQLCAVVVSAMVGLGTVMKML